jgi:hypothetical protein
MSDRSEKAGVTPRRRRLRRGFALPMAILALALMTAAIIAAFSATSAEVVANSAMRAQDHAYQLAEAGLEQFMLRRGEAGFCSNCVTDPTVVDSEWTKVSYAGGYATVVAMRVRPKLADGSPALFFIRSTGVDTMVKLSGAGIATRATRAIGQYATFGTASVKPLAAWTSLYGVTNSATKAPASGTDACGKMSTLPGVAVPSGLFNYISFGTAPTGSPPVDQTMTLDSLKSRIGIDWNGIINYNAIPADITIPGGAFPSNGTFIADTSYWPVIHVKTSYTIPNDGRGIIIADSDLTFSQNNAWDGIVLVGGRIISSGADSTTGVSISGLNLTLPNAVNPGNTLADNDPISNKKRFSYNSCTAARAAARLQIYFAWTNTWNDNVAIW